MSPPGQIGYRPIDDGCGRTDPASVVPVVRLLGPMALAGVDGRSVGPPRQRLVLAVLAADAGRPVPVDRLVDRVWGSDPPPQAHRTLHAYIARTRRILEQIPVWEGGPVRVEWRDSAYLLDVDPTAVDLHRFRRLVMSAREPRCSPRRRAELLREATGLWRGAPLTGLGGAWAERSREAWGQERAAAVVAWAEAELDGGDPAAVLGPVTELAAEHPLFEPLAAAAVRILARVGRVPDAIRYFETVRTRLAEELGVDPGAELQRAHLVALRAQLDLPPSTVGVVPAQLPSSPAVFTGRVRELACLDALLASAVSGRSTNLAVLSGGAGVGKTALAVHWAHRVAAQFPDGQLFVDLRAFGPDRQVVSPAEAVRRFLDALGAPPERIPAEPDAQAAMYRSLMAGRRLLIVLDNARDPAQVRPLLPGTPGCLVLVTSRHQLTGLFASDGGRLIAVGLLPPDEAVGLLASRLGAERTDAQPRACREIVDRCGRLPLALAIVAARAATKPHLPLAAVVESLTDHVSRWESFANAADPPTDLWSAFSWSYRELTPPAARLFRLLGLHPGPDVSITAAASLAGESASDAARQLSVLVGVNLVAEPLPGRYQLHDLLREYAEDLAQRIDEPFGCAAAVARLDDHYLHTAEMADRLLRSPRGPTSLMAAEPGAVVGSIADHSAALEWFDAERDALVETIRRAAKAGHDTRVAQLAWLLTDYLERRGEYHSLVSVQRAALAVHVRRGDLAAQVDALRVLARAATRLHQFPEAFAHLLRALDLAEQLGDRTGQAKIHHNLAMLWEHQDRCDIALGHARQALHLYRQLGDRRGQGLALNGVGWCHSRLGAHDAALSACQEALTLLESIGERSGAADAMDSIAHAHNHLGRYDEAARHYRQAIDVYQELGHRYREADTLTRLAETHQAMGSTSAALDTWRKALAILTGLGHPNAAAIRARIAQAEGGARSAGIFQNAQRNPANGDEPPVPRPATDHTEDRLRPVR
jgi:DNA-binding SARP family transcriptional activator/tetratricopeptide (TPR) repeat protein